MAIVDLQQQTYIGRLFFGDADSGAVVWDCDCRPSDGCWLALKVRTCPATCPAAYGTGNVSCYTRCLDESIFN